MWLAYTQACRHQPLDDVVEYFGGLDSDPARPGEGGAAVFKPGWEDIFRMNQKQLEVAVRRMWSDPGAPLTPPFSAAILHFLCDGTDDNHQLSLCQQQLCNCWKVLLWVDPHGASASLSLRWSYRLHEQGRWFQPCGTPAWQHLNWFLFCSSIAKCMECMMSCANLHGQAIRLVVPSKLKHACCPAILPSPVAQMCPGFAQFCPGFAQFCPRCSLAW